jgi:hypothetical protein
MDERWGSDEERIQEFREWERQADKGSGGGSSSSGGPNCLLTLLSFLCWIAVGVLIGALM